MPFTADVLADINASALKNYINKGSVRNQNIQNKPLMNALNAASGRFAGGNGLTVSEAVASGQGGGAISGFEGDDQVPYYNPTGTERAEYSGKEHHLGMVLTLSELKQDGIRVIEEERAEQEVVNVDGREEFALVNILETKYERLDEDWNVSWDLLLHGDGSTDPKAIAGIRALVLDNPIAGVTGGLSRAIFPWWRNRAATAAFAGAGGQGPITVNPANGGALIEFLDTEMRQLGRYVQSAPNWKIFAGSAFIDGYKRELRANGYYSDSMSTDSGVPDGSMKDPRHAGRQFVYDPTLDDLGFSKRAYVLDLSKNGINLKYFDGVKKQRHKPARPYDRYVMYNGITTTAVLTAGRLRTSAVYDIA